MPDSLTVHLNHDGPHSIEAAAGTFETDGPFDILLENHGAALHVHLNLDDDLATAARIDTTNRFIEADRIERVPVTVDTGRMPAEGRLKVVTGYGSETAYVTVSLAERDEGRTPVDVDEGLASPPVQSPEPEPEERDLPVVTIGIVVAFIATIVAISVGGTAGMVGLAVVLVGIGIAVLLFRT